MSSPLGGIAPIGIGAPGSVTSITNAGIPPLKTGEGGRHQTFILMISVKADTAWFFSVTTVSVANFASLLAIM